MSQQIAGVRAADSFNGDRYSGTRWVTLSLSG